MIMCSAFEVEPTSILTSLRGGQRDERLDVVVRQSGEDSSANQPTFDNKKNIYHIHVPEYTFQMIFSRVQPSINT